MNKICHFVPTLQAPTLCGMNLNNDALHNHTYRTLEELSRRGIWDVPKRIRRCTECMKHPDYPMYILASL